MCSVQPQLAMQPSTQHTSHRNPGESYKILIRNFFIEIVIYGGLVALYYAVALRFLASPLNILFDRSLQVYAVAGLLLIVAQSVLLERLTFFLLERLELQRFE